MEPKGNDMAGDELIERLDDQSRRYQSVILTLPEWADVRARLSRSTSTEAVAVKALEWTNYVEPPFVRYARCSIGMYRVERGRVSGSGWWFYCNGNMGDEGHATEAEAETAAQADYERRIRSALTCPSLQGGAEPDGRYTEGVCADGAAILCDGQMMTISDILAALNSHSIGETGGADPAVVMMQEFVDMMHAEKGETGGTETGDHERGCQGREYTCTCGYDDKRDALVASLRAERDAAVDDRDLHKQAFNDSYQAALRLDASLAAEKLLREQAEEKANDVAAAWARDAEFEALEQRVAALVGALTDIQANELIEPALELMRVQEVARCAATEA